MNWNYVIPVLIFLPLSAFQLAVIPLISIYDISPNLILIVIVYYTLINGQIFGMLIGFLFGFLFDLISGGLLGASMLSFTISAFFAGYFYNRNKIDINTASLLFILILFLCGTINSFIYSGISNSNSDISLIRLFLYIGILPGLYTSLLGLTVIIFKPKKGIV
jgi:rod shape-determining protein MreD